MGGARLRGKRMVAATGVASAAVTVALVFGPGGAGTSTAADLPTIAGIVAAAQAAPSGAARPAVGSRAEDGPRFSATAMSDYFLKIDGIDGESADDKHKGEIEIQSFSWGVTNPVRFRSGLGARAGKASFQDFHFTSVISKASPKLALACASGQHIKSATITLRKAGEQPLDYLKIELKDILVSSYQSAGSNGEVAPQDQFSLNFTKILVEYRAQNDDGSLGDPVTMGWDLALNKKL